MLLELAIVFALIALNGVLALSELAIVSARPARLKPLEAKSKGAAAALRLAEHPGRFLSTVQIGITLVGVLSGAFSGATLGGRLTDFLIRSGVEPYSASTFGVGGVVVVLTYFSLIVGELVPKQLALRDPEGMAIKMAPAMTVLSRVAAPLVWLLEGSGRLVLWLMGQRDNGPNRVTEEEVHLILTEAHEGGVLEDEEREMMAGVMRLADRTVRALMSPRHEVEMLELEMTSAEAVQAMRKIGRARMPVISRETGEVVGIVLMADAFRAVSRREPIDLRVMVQDVPVVSDRADAIDAIEVLHRSAHHFAFVYDEYGHFEGLITTADVLEAITGSIVTAQTDEPAMQERVAGGYLVAGWMPADEFCDQLSLPREIAGEYDTVAGIVLHQLNGLPKLGEIFSVEGYTFEVVDLDGFRIDKVLVTLSIDPGSNDLS